MAAITDWAEWKALRSRGVPSCFQFGWSNGAHGGAVPYSLYNRAQRLSSSGVNYTTSEALTSDKTSGNSAGALLDTDEIPLSGTPELWLAEVEIVSNHARNIGTNRGQTQSYLIADRLVQVGGFSCNVTTEQTTNLPHTALTRYTSGEGVVAALEVLSTWTASVAQTATINYTNQAGVSGRTSRAVAIGSTNANGSVDNIRFFPLQEGDTGIRSIQGVTLSGSCASTGPTDFGLVLMKVLGVAPPVPCGSGWARPPVYDFFQAGKIIKVEYGASLQLITMNANLTTGVYNARGAFKILKK